jgi:hypothetical protein
VDEAEFHTTVRHFYLEEEAEEVHFAVAFFVAAAAVAAVAAVVFSFAAAVKVRDRDQVVVVATVESSFFEELGVHRPFFEECDLLAVHLVHPIHPRFQYSTDSTFVVLRRIMLRYYSLIIIYNLNNILFLYYFRIFILIVSWHI